MTAKLALLGCPCGTMPVAPALGWASEIWTALTLERGRHLRMPQLRQAWQDAKPEEVRGWRDCQGPLAAAVLSLRRMGWQTKGPFVWIDDLGQELRLTELSPKLTQSLLYAGIQRSLERRLAAKLGAGGAEAPAAEQPRAMLDLAHKIDEVDNAYSTHEGSSGIIDI